MRSRRAIRAHRSAGRDLARDVAELAHAAVGAAAAGELSRRAFNDLAGQAYPGRTIVAATVAGHCVGDGQRSALAAYLYLCRDLSMDSVAAVFGIDPSAARRLVERGTGTAPVTAGDECRGWALVAPRPGRTPVERQAGAGHLSLCRKCRNKLRAHALIEQRVAAAGSVAFGASVTAAIGRAFAGSHAAGSAAGVLTAPIVALSTAAALTAGAGTFALTSHGEGRHRPSTGPVRPHPGAPAGVDANPADTNTTPAAVSRSVPRRSPAGAPTTANPTPSVPGPPPVQKLVPLPALTAVPLPSVSVPALPLPTVSVSPPALPTSLPLPLPKLPQLP